MADRQRIAIGLEYDGRGFEGWQTQPHGRTVQDALERALGRIADTERVATVCAGRTDTGVHATVQVAHFDAPVARPDQAWVRGVNSHLPEGVAVLWARPVDEGFHARFRAQSRIYRYLLLNRPVRPGLLAGRVGWHHLPLDVEAMAQAAQGLVGTHDFSAFRAAACQARSPVREMRRVALSRRGDLIVFEFEANAFLHHMIRNLVGALVYVGKGAWTAGRLASVLAARDRSQAAPTFSPDGLYLCGVDYSDAWLLPERGRIISRPLFAGE
ncbi:MAG: tRNA pseudouridine(38-40) synthase TruA [Rhodocyclaceae bacterium]|nr:tRNA pseudouridine(38-40) synthase TruA [Rhodocyclaceae bacterium]